MSLVFTVLALSLLTIVAMAILIPEGLMVCLAVAIGIIALYCPVILAGFRS